MVSTCGQEAMDNNWDIARINACHIGVINFEMGELRDAQMGMAWKLDIIFWVSAVIVMTVIGLTIKKMWGGRAKQ